MTNQSFKVMPIKELERAFGSRFHEDEFGIDARILKLTDLNPPSMPIILGTGGSAGDSGTLRENISQYFPLAEKYGRALGEYSIERKDLPLVHMTGGTPNIPYVIAVEAKKANSKLFSLAMYPKLTDREVRQLAEGILPEHLQFYDWVVLTDLYVMQRAVIVGEKSDVFRAHHGAEGTAVEVACAKHAGRVAITTPYGSTTGITQNIDTTLNLSYTDRGGVIFKETRPKEGYQRGIAEHFARMAKATGASVSNLNVYLRSENGKLFLNPRDAPPVTTELYQHLAPLENLVLAGVTRDELLNYITQSFGLDGWLKIVQVRKELGEVPYILRAHSPLRERILTDIEALVANALAREAPFRLISRNSEVPIM